MKKKLFVILAVMFLAMWLFSSANKTHTNQKSPNIISHVEQPPVILKTSPTTNKNQSPQPITSMATPQVQTKPQKTSTYSYLQLYRDFHRLEICPINKRSLMAANSIKDLKQQLLKSFERYGMQVNQPVSATHLNHYESNLDRCIQLRDKYKGIDMEQQLLSAPTKTEKEKQLQTLRRLIQPWDDVWQHLFNASKGISSPEALAIKKKLDELEAMWRQQFQGSEFEFTEAERNTYFETKKTLQAQLEQLTDINPKTKDQAWQQVQKLTAKIKTYMRLQDPDLFFEASGLLNDDRQLRFFNASTHGRSFKQENLEKLKIPYIKVAEEVNQLTGQISKLNFLAIAPYANQLYLCTLGQDCSPGSTLMNHYCLNTEYPTACEKDLVTFFMDDYLSPNQLQDVLNLHEQLEIIYAP